MNNCQYCECINTVMSSTYNKQINGVLYYFVDIKNFKQYVKQCCLLKYAFNETNRTEDFNNRILHLLKIKTCKYLLVNNIPMLVYELKFKNTEVFYNPHAYMFGAQYNVTVNRSITLQEIKDKYKFITKTQYTNYINSLSNEQYNSQQGVLLHNMPTNIGPCNSENIERLYLIHNAVAIAAKENVYKIGRTSVQDLSRFKNYPKGSKVLFLMECSESVFLEKNIIEIFKSKYTFRPDRGSEYFQGCKKSMIKDIINIINEFEEI